ncbi:hypothetical protein [Dokdonella sp.]|uniref:hypothetical protein n=1 Tax=Dokdonella sp. TaxID=2291710 RepID=UPI003C5EA6CF
MNFTSDEKALISYFAHQEGSLNRWGFYLAALVPIFAFGGYGLLRQDLVALGMAFFAQLGFLLWHVSASRRYSRILASICRKLEDGHANGPVAES